MNDPEEPLDGREVSVPEPGPDTEPRFDEPERPAPEVVDAPGRNIEF